MNKPKTPAKAAKRSVVDYMAELPKAHRERMQAAAAAARENPPAPSLKLSVEGDTITIGYDHESANFAKLMQILDIGTVDSDFHSGFVSQLARVGSQGRTVDCENTNFVLAVVRAAKPRDELEAMLAAQMGVIHDATMMMARRLNTVKTIPQQDSAERALNKLARTYATQMEALKRYRTGGQQKVTVEHVTVNEGGQAIVGVVSTGRAGGVNSPSQG